MTISAIAAAALTTSEGIKMTSANPIDTTRWIFTFGFGHKHPTTGESLANRYVVIDGDIDETRAVMDRHFGNKWAFQYPTEEAAGVERWNLERIDLP